MVATVVEKYRKLKTTGSAGALAVKLAKVSFFGKGVLARCTVYRARDKPVLPRSELSQLKQAKFNLFPQQTGLIVVAGHRTISKRISCLYNPIWSDIIAQKPA